MADSGGAGAPPPAQDGGAAGGVYCSTAGTFFHDKESLAEHYRSDFHRYNLKRKVAGLPPVTKEWFEARRAQLLLQQQQQQQQGGGGANAASSSAAAANADTQLMLGASAQGAATTGDDRVWYDPLTRRRFYSENTYVAHTRSRKYSELVKKSGAPPPPPVVSRRPAAEVVTAAGAQAGAAGGGQQGPAPGVSAEGKRRHRAPRGEAAAAGGFVVKPAAGTSAARLAAAEAAAAAAAAGGQAQQPPHAEADEEDQEEEDGSEWETASMEEDDEDEDDEAARWAEADAWDARRSLFDTRVAPTLEDNLEYMWKTYGFSIPDAEACADPEGLLRYLGAKLAVGRVPLYARGDDANARRFRSLHAVQRHMVDSGRCRMLYDDNEEEYEEFYDYSRVEQEGEEGEAMEAEGGGGESGALVVSGGGGRRGGAKAAPGEGVVVASSSSSAKPLVLGTRALARYYKQRTRPDPAARESVAAALVVARYRALGVETLAKAARREAARAARGGTGVASASRDLRKRLAVSMRANVNNDLPKNVPY